MSACNFTIPFTGSAEDILEKASSAVKSQGGMFAGDTTSGNFDVSVFGNTIIGTYQVSNNNLNIIIESKPFLVPCSMIEGFLKSKIV